MTWENTSYILNAVSGILLVGLGALTAFRPKQKPLSGLSLFLMAWGAQLALTNAAARSEAQGASHLLFWLGEFFLPLQSLLLLYYVSQRASEQSNSIGRRIYAVCRVASLVVAACMAAAIVLAVITPSSLLNVRTADDGSSILHASPLASTFFDGPQFLGIALALLLLTWQRPTHDDRLALSGLALAWAYSLAYPLAYELREPTMPLVIILSLAFVLVGIVVPARMVWSAAWQPRDAHTRIAGAAIPAFAGLAWFVPLVSGIAFVLLAPGLVRIIALVWLLQALWYDNILEVWRGETARGRTVPIGFTVISVFGAVVIISLSIFTPANLGPFSTYAFGLSLAALVLIAGIGVWQIRHLLFGGAKPA